MDDGVNCLIVPFLEIADCNIVDLLDLTDTAMKIYSDEDIQLNAFIRINTLSMSTSMPLLKVGDQGQIHHFSPALPVSCSFRAVCQHHSSQPSNDISC